MNITSAMAYEDIVKNGLVGKMQRDVLSRVVVFNNQGINPTGSEVASALNAQKSVITPRLRELELCMVLRKVGQRKCSRTGRQAQTYEFTGSRPLKTESFLKTCPLCEGLGKVQKDG